MGITLPPPFLYSVGGACGSGVQWSHQLPLTTINYWTNTRRKPPKLHDPPDIQEKMRRGKQTITIFPCCYLTAVEVSLHGKKRYPPHLCCLHNRDWDNHVFTIIEFRDYHYCTLCIRQALCDFIVLLICLLHWMFISLLHLKELYAVDFGALLPSCVHS